MKTELKNELLEKELERVLKPVESLLPATKPFKKLLYTNGSIVVIGVVTTLAWYTIDVLVVGYLMLVSLCNVWVDLPTWILCQYTL